MDRLTKRTPKGDAYLANVKDDEQEVECRSRNTAQCIMDSWERLAAYEDTGMEPAEIKQMCALARLNSTIFDDDFENHIAELIVADRDGRLVVLPCKVGDTFYRIEQQWTLCHLGNYRGEYSCEGCEEEECDSKKVPEIVAHKCSTVSQLAAYIGKPVFLTRPEAEAALDAMKGGGE
jgi:hypothetical protein